MSTLHSIDCRCHYCAREKDIAIGLVVPLLAGLLIVALLLIAVIGLLAGPR